MDDLGLARLLDGCQHVYSDVELRQKLERARREGRQLRVKLGMDPTAPDIHLGHSVVLRKLRQFQDLGHRAVLIIGDFTARIGDPTGRSRTRPVLTEQEIYHNAQTYMEQAGRILDLSDAKFEVRRNSEWLGGMTFADVLRLAAGMTVGQMLKREDFRKRFESETPIGVHELLYPLMQGWDSVMIRADVELGGTDQTYNNLVGRDLQQREGQEPQVVMILPILRGTDGVKKMSKSLGNYIAVTDPPRDMFGKTMSIPDALLEEWFALLTDVPREEAQAAIAAHPMKAKDLLARRIGERFHPPGAMDEAAAWWHEHFSGRTRAVEVKPVRVPVEELNGDGTIPAWKLAWLAHDRQISRSEARRMVEGGAFEIDVGPRSPPPAAVGASGSPGATSSEPRGDRHEADFAADRAPHPSREGQEADFGAERASHPSRDREGAGAAKTPPPPACGGLTRITDPNFSVRPRPGLRFRAGRHRSGEQVKQPLLAEIVQNRPQT